MTIRLTWKGGEHDFDLSKIELLRALQQRCDAGPHWVLTRLRTGQWHVEDVLEPIRLGLEGAGMAKAEAARLTQMHVEGRLAISVLTAIAVLGHALYGNEDDPVGEPPGEGLPTPILSPEEKSSGAPSTEPAQS